MTMKLYTTADIQILLNCCANTARKYMRQMDHMEQPLRVPAPALDAWMETRMCPPEAQRLPKSRSRVVKLPDRLERRKA